MNPYASLADDMYVNMNLNTAMPLPGSRETILSFFERLQKTYPTMRNFYTRENGDYVLEEEKEHGQQRWVALEPRRVCSWFVNPEELDTAFEQHAMVLQLLPYMLSVSPLDCEALDFLIGFDFNYRGNHDALVAEALGTSPAFEGLLDMPDAQMLKFEPSMTLTLEDSCRRQARLFIETRSTAFHVRHGEYQDEPISVYFTVRQYGSLDPGIAFEDTLSELRTSCEKLLESCVVNQILRPLALAISAAE